MLIGWAYVVGFGANEAVVADLFQDVCGPTSNAADGKGWCKEVTWQANGGK
jgi:hypothetical protein